MSPFLSFARGLFLGVVQPERIHPFPEPDDEERETASMLLDSFRELAEEHLDGARFDREKAVPASVRSALADMGLFGLTIPEEHGGAGLSYSTYCRIMEEANRYCGSTAVILGGHQSIGIKALLLHGTEQQKREWLPRLASGEWLAAYALSEPQAGSDPASLETVARPAPDGASYRITGQKIWCTNGGFAEFITVFARIEGDEGGITCFVLTPDELGAGFARGTEEDKLGLRGSSTTQLFFDEVSVPAANVLGRPGGGLRVAFEVLNYGRTSLAAGCAGASKRILREAAAHAAARVQFGRPIAEFELIQEKLAEALADTHATETIAYLTSAMADRGDADFSIEAAASKVFGTEAHWRTCNHAVQVAGGIAYVGEYPYERFLRDARINMIFEGTNEILYHFMAMSGLREVQAALADQPGGGPDALRARAIALRGGTEPRDLRLDGPLAAELPALREAVAALARGAACVVERHGEGLADAQLDQRRLAGAAMDLFVAHACACRAERPETSESEVVVARKCVRDALGRVGRGLDALERNDDGLTVDVSRIATSSPEWPHPLRP